MAYEDYTGYTEADPNNRFTVAQNQITITNLPRNEDAYVYEDFGVGGVPDTFTHQLEAECTGHGSGFTRFNCWAATDDVDDAWYWYSNNSEALSLGCDWDENNSYVRFTLFNHLDSNNNDVAASLDEDTRYYLRIVRSGGSITVYIYDDSGRTSLVDTISVSVTAGRTYRWLYAVGSWSQANPVAISGVVANLDLGGATTTTQGATTTTTTTQAPTTTTTTPGPTTTTTPGPSTTPAGSTTTPEPSTTTADPASGTHIYINGVENTDLVLRRITASFTQPWAAELHYPGRHDEYRAVKPWDSVRIDIDGTTRFRGNITQVNPGGVAREGVAYLAQDRRFRLANEPVRINGAGHYTWNRRGYLCTDGDGGEDSPGKDGGKWTAGEIVVDILEHALGLPAGGSDISGHHGTASCVSGTYLDSADVAGYTASDILALDSYVGEFTVDDTPVADAISELLALNGGFYGWHIDPASGELVVTDLDSESAVSIAAGEHGHWQDEAGKDYALLGNELSWSLDGVFSTIRIQGSDKTQEEQPANIEGTANAGAGNLGELELVAAPWKGFAAVYRAAAQPTRRFTLKPIDDAGTYTPPNGYYSYPKLPRVYQGTAAGSKTVWKPTGSLHPYWMVPAGLIGFANAPSLGVGEKLWGWYHAAVPFVATRGPEGDAWAHYGYERTRTVYDPGFKHTSSYPQAGTADDATAMDALAERLLRLYRDVRRQGRLTADGVDFSSFILGRRYGVTNLGPTTLAASTTAPGSSTTPGPSTTTPWPDPMDWDTLRVNAVEVAWDFESGTTELTVANTFFMLPEYSEMKRRLETNLFVQRDLDLSESIYECQVQAPVGRIGSDSGGDAGSDDPDPTTTTTTSIPGTTTTPYIEPIGGDENDDPNDATEEDSSTWDNGDGPAKLTWLWRVVDDPDNQQVLGYYRTTEIDAAGTIQSISAENEVVLLETGDCCNPTTTTTTGGA